MSTTIYKYTLPVAGSAPIEMPEGAEILTVHDQDDAICLWAMVDPYAEKEIRHFEVYGTGMDFPCGNIERRYVGTAHTYGGKLVWHVFERPSSV